MRNTVLILAIAPVVAAASAHAMTISTLIKAGEVINGTNVVAVDNLSVNNSGQWIVQVDTDATPGLDGILIRNGSIFLQEGQPIAGAPSGSVTISSFDAVNLNNAGVFGGNIFLAGTGSLSTDSGVYQDANLVMQESTFSIAPQFSPNTPYIGWFETKLNNSGQHLVMASVDDPAIATSVDRALVRWNVSPTGTLLSETVLAKEGDILPGHTQAVADFLTGPHAMDFNDAGTAMFVVDGNGSTADDFAVYVGNTMVAREGSASPIGGRTWSATGLGSSRVALNNAGDYVYTGTLDNSDPATDLVIIKNNAKFMQEGDNLPAIGSFTLVGFGTGTPVDIDDFGNVLWFGQWNDPDTTKDTGLFLNDQLLVQEGVTVIDGLLLVGLTNGQNAFKISENGEWVIFEGTVAGPSGNQNGAFLINVPEPAGAGVVVVGLALALARRRRRAR